MNDKFDSHKLDSAIIALPLLKLIKEKPADKVDIIIDLSHNYSEGRVAARTKVIELVEELKSTPGLHDDDDKKIRVQMNKTLLSHQYVFASMPAKFVTRLIGLDREAEYAIFRVWPDFEVQSQMMYSESTIKADAAHYSFSASGEKITWAVMDSGVDFSHPHFALHDNKARDYHMDLHTDDRPFDDDFGHGTHVAGIIAGQIPETSKRKNKNIAWFSKSKDEKGDLVYEKRPIDKISGIAPKCKLVSLKVLGDKGKGHVSSLIAAIGHIQEVNNYGRDIKIHGVNMSLGYTFDPEWFACGQSPLCVEVNRLVKSGVVVVAAAGNSGYGFISTKYNDRMSMGIDLSINDPGNAELAITVGSTHRDMPHTYGVSYFSSKGPTGDGRMKPDLVAPGEKIVSCAVGSKKAAYIKKMGEDKDICYGQESGTSMAAPHVSGAIAALLSIRREYIGQAEKVKEIFTSSATNLNRDPYFQGKGLLDLMRAIQSV